MTTVYDPDPYWEQRGGSTYRQYVQSPGYAKYREEQDRFFADLVARLRPVRLLDFGCGTGKAFPLWKHVPEVHVYDRSLSQLEVARQEAARVGPDNSYKFPPTVPESRTELPYADDAFDLVVTAEVLLHVVPQEIGAMIAELHRVCSGHLAFVTAAPFEQPAPHNFSHDYSDLMDGLFRTVDDHVVHQQRYIVGEKLPVEAATAMREERHDAVVTT